MVIDEQKNLRTRLVIMKHVILPFFEYFISLYINYSRILQFLRKKSFDMGVRGGGDCTKLGKHNEILFGDLQVPSFDVIFRMLLTFTLSIRAF